MVLLTAGARTGGTAQGRLTKAVELAVIRAVGKAVSTFPFKRVMPRPRIIPRVAGFTANPGQKSMIS